MRSRVGLLALVGIVALIASPAVSTASPGDDQAPEPSEPKTIDPDVTSYTYEIAQRGRVRTDIEEFEALVSVILEEPGGWTRAGVELERVDSDGDVVIVLASPVEVAAADPGCSALWSCRLGDEVLINDQRWRGASPAWRGTLEKYRHYLVNHEVGHWLGLGHVECAGPGAPAPVMQQQSIDLNECEPNGRPLESEIDEVADLHGTDPVHPQDQLDEPRISRWADAIRRGSLAIRFR